MTETETLYCQIGNHHYERPRSRGRKPIACDEHRGVTIQADLITEVTITEVNQELAPAKLQEIQAHIETTKAELEVASEKDRLMLEDRLHWLQVDLKEVEAALPPEQRIETLHCEAGHDWTRPRQKGKRPKWCPEHHPANQKKERLVTNKFPLEKVMLEFNPSEEIKYKLNYIDKQLQRDRDPLDIKMLLDTQQQLITRMRRQSKTIA